MSEPIVLLNRDARTLAAVLRYLEDATTTWSIELSVHVRAGHEGLLLVARGSAPAFDQAFRISGGAMQVEVPPRSNPS